MESFQHIYNALIRLTLFDLATMMKGSHTNHVHDVALDLPLDMSSHTSHDHSHHHHGDHDYDKARMGSGVSAWIR